MKANIYGEESNTFSNALGASITVKVEETPEQTAEVSILNPIRVKLLSKFSL